MSATVGRVLITTRSGLTGVQGLSRLVGTGVAK